MTSSLQQNGFAPTVRQQGQAFCLPFANDSLPPCAFSEAAASDMLDLFRETSSVKSRVPT